ncbi:MAG: hypothetical protein AB7I48_13520 [Planctomycetaceae bacterium]
MPFSGLSDLCRQFDRLSDRRLYGSLLGACCAVCLACPGDALAAEGGDDEVLQRSTSVGIGRFRRGAWGIAGVEVVNRGETPVEVISGLYFDGDPLAQFSRKVWIPAGASRTTWIPVQPPDAKMDELRMRPFLYRMADDGSQTLVKSSKELMFDAETLPTAASPVTAIVDDRAVEKTDSLDTTRELAVAMRLAARQTRNITELRVDDIPAFAEGLDAVDHVVLAGNRIAESPTGLASVRTWLQQGGRLWILLDQVDVRTVELLLGDAAGITEVDRVRLASTQLDNLVKQEPSGPLIEHEEPVDFVRVLTPGLDVTHEVNGWPAAFRLNVGHGRVVVTTLSSAAWMRPRLPHEQVRELDRNSTFIARQSLEEVADYLTRPLSSPPLSAEDWRPFVSEQIGYRIPGRGSVLSILGLFWTGLIGLGVYWQRSARLERLAIVGPVVAICAAAPLVLMGEQSRRAIPATAAVAELVEVGPGSSESHSTGLAAMFVPEPAIAAIAGRNGRLLIPERDRVEGSVRRMAWTDLDDWHWENLTLPAGLDFAATEQHTTVPAALRAVATFGPEGLTGNLELGSYADPADGLIATTANQTLAVHVQPDGRFSAGKPDVLPPGVAVQGTFLSDEQRRRSAVYQVMLQPRSDFTYPDRPMLLVWTRPIDTGLTFPDDMQQSASALLAIPLEIQSPPPDTKVFIPPPLLTFENLATGDATQTTAYDSRTRLWQKTSYATTALLRFRVPRPLLPLTVARGTLSISLRAPMRTVDIATGAAGQLVPLTSLDNAVGTYEFPIEQPDGLRLDDDGGLHVQLVVSDLQPDRAAELETKDVDRSWKMDFIHLDLSGRTAERPE